MNSPALPESMDDWPSNLYELFGVSEKCSDRDLRRAYHRLIKIYRAEEYPEQFRKLNESYESLRARLRYEEEYRRQQENQDEESEEGDIEWFPNPPSSMFNDRQESPQPSRNVADCSVLYQTALEGDVDAAISKLEKFCQHNPQNEDSALQLFWLTKITSGEPAFEVLETYLKQNGLTGRAFQVYLNELDRIPDAALRVSCRELLLASAGDPRMTGLTRLVWFLLYTKKSLKRIEQDLKDLKDDLVYDYPEQWKELVYQAVEFMALAGLPKSNATFQKLREEARECETIPGPEWIETRWEMVRHISCDAGVPGAIPDNLVNIIRDSMMQDDWELRHRLEMLILPWVSVPSVGLATLDRLREWSPTATYLFHRSVSNSRSDEYLYYDKNASEQIRPAVLRFVNTSKAKSYSDLRLDVCQFCKYEDLSLDWFLQSLIECQQAEQTRFLQDDVIKMLDEDWPLKALIAALRVFNE